MTVLIFGCILGSIYAALVLAVGLPWRQTVVIFLLSALGSLAAGALCEAAGHADRESRKAGHRRLRCLGEGIKSPVPETRGKEEKWRYEHFPRRS